MNPLICDVAVARPLRNRYSAVAGPLLVATNIVWLACAFRRLVGPSQLAPGPGWSRPGPLVLLRNLSSVITTTLQTRGRQGSTTRCPTPLIFFIPAPRLRSTDSRHEVDSRVICIFGKELLAGILPPHARSTSRALASTVAGGCGAWLRDGKTASAARSIIPQPPAPPLPPAPTRGQCSAEPVAGPHHHRRALRGRLRCAASLFLTTEEETMPRIEGWVYTGQQPGLA